MMFELAKEKSLTDDMIDDMNYVGSIIFLNALYGGLLDGRTEEGPGELKKIAQSLLVAVYSYKRKNYGMHRSFVEKYTNELWHILFNLGCTQSVDVDPSHNSDNIALSGIEGE